jgi:hypothetical protein
MPLLKRIAVAAAAALAALPAYRLVGQPDEPRARNVILFLGDAG